MYISDACLGLVESWEIFIPTRFGSAALFISIGTCSVTCRGEVDRGGVEETLTYYGFPSSHWWRIRTNNPMESIIREIRRRSRMVGAFPDGQSALMLCAARLEIYANLVYKT